MLVGIAGKMGTGKTLTMSILASFLHTQFKVPLASNMPSLKNGTLIKNTADLWQIENGIVCIDEAWITLDSRLWKDNVALTRWINQTRKKKLLVFYTTQHIRQIELRMRNATDVLIVCEKKAGEHWLNFIDYQYGILGRRFLLARPERFYGLYDTYEIINTIEHYEKRPVRY